MAAKFLCCLPLRLGVIVISFIQFLLTGAVSGLLWWALWYSDKNDLATVTNSMRTTAIIVASIYTAASFVGLLGFLGAVFKKNGFVKTFYVLLCAVFGFQIGGGVWYLVTFYRSRNESLEHCINGSTDQNRIVFCQSLKRIPQGFLIASVVTPIVVVGYACYVVRQYSRRLDDQKTEKLRQSFMPTTNPVYQPVNRGDEYPLMQSQYAYATPTNAFGHNRSGSDANNKV